MIVSLAYLAALISGAGDSLPSVCDTIKGTEPELISPAQLSEALAALPVQKDEFETTSDFVARQGKVLTKLPNPWVIYIKPDPSGMKYDADKQVMNFTAAMFANYGAVDTSMMRIGLSQFAYSSIIIEGRERRDGTYSAVNGFGAQFDVIKETRDLHVLAILPREDCGLEPLFCRGGDVLAHLQIAPDLARKMKD